MSNRSKPITRLAEPGQWICSSLRKVSSPAPLNTPASTTSPGSAMVRFDVVSILFGPGEPQVEHFDRHILVRQSRRRLVGILTNRDVRFAENPRQPVSELMTRENLATVPQGTSQEDARRRYEELRASLWDLFRFRPGTANAGNFGSAPRVLTKGGTQVMFGNFTSTFASQSPTM